VSTTPIDCLRSEFDRLEAQAEDSIAAYKRNFQRRQGRWVRSKVILIFGACSVSVLAFLANSFPGYWFLRADTQFAFWAGLSAVLLASWQTLDAFSNHSGFAAKQFLLYHEYRRARDVFRARWVARVECRSGDGVLDAAGTIVEEFAEHLSRIREQAVSADNEVRTSADRSTQKPS